MPPSWSAARGFDTFCCDAPSRSASSPTVRSPSRSVSSRCRRIGSDSSRNRRATSWASSSGSGCGTMTGAAGTLDNYVVVEHRTGRSPAMPTTAAEIDAAAFEGELRNGRPLTVLDVRDRDGFGAWHVAAPAATVLNVPEDDVAADVAGTVAALPGDRPVRVICNVGNMSLRVAALLDRHATDVRSVRGGMVGWSRVLQAAPVPMPAPWTVVQLRREARGCLSYL